MQHIGVPALSRRLSHLLLLVTVFAGSGASCPQILRQYTQPEPRVLSEHPSLDEVVSDVLSVVWPHRSAFLKFRREKQLRVCSACTWIATLSIEQINH